MGAWTSRRVRRAAALVGCAALVTAVALFAVATASGGKPGAVRQSDTVPGLYSWTGPSGLKKVSGTLDLNAALSLRSVVAECPSGVSASTCSDRTSTGLSAGLGPVTGTYTFLLDTGPPVCADGLGRARAYPVRFSVASKGEIRFQLAAGVECVNGAESHDAREQTQTFTVTRGTGIYAGASGTGTVKRGLGTNYLWLLRERDVDRHPHRAGPRLRPHTADTGWCDQQDGASQKGCEVDLVAFRVTAKDDRDGTLPVACTPKSGSRFKLGRTRVTCSSIDSSANTAKASFTVTVRPRRNIVGAVSSPCSTPREEARSGRCVAIHSPPVCADRRDARAAATLSRSRRTPPQRRPMPRDRAEEVTMASERIQEPEDQRLRDAAGDPRALDHGSFSAPVDRHVRSRRDGVAVDRFKAIEQYRHDRQVEAHRAPGLPRATTPRADARAIVDQYDHAPA